MHAAGETSASAPASADHGSAIAEGHRLAGSSGRPPGSVDVLLGLLRAGGAAARLLEERGITPSRLEAILEQEQVRMEPVFNVAQLERASHEIAVSLGARQTSSLHLLLALLREGGSAADALRLAGQDPAKIRALVLRALTGPSRLAERTQPRPASAPPASGAWTGPAATIQHGASPGAAREATAGTGNGPLVARPTATVAAQGSVTAAWPSPLPAGVAGSPENPPARPFSAASTATTPARPPTAANSNPAAGAARPVIAPASTSVAEDSAPAAEDWELLPIEAPRTPVLHRDREVGRLLDLLQARTARVIAVVGDPGSGRSAVLSALAAAAADKPVLPTGALPVAPSPGALLQELHRRAPLSSPIVLDGCSFIGGEGGDGPAQLLATARAGRRWIVVATAADLRRFELGAPDLATSLETVALSPLPADALSDVLESALEAIADGAGVAFAPEVCRALTRLSPRYPSDRAQPGRSLAIAEIAAARAARLGREAVGEAEVAEVVADAAAVPLARLLRTDDERFRTLEARLAERVVGHEAARARMSDLLRRAYAGFRGRRPLASLLLLGPTGVGKTETAKAIADALFDGESALVRIDLSEYSEPHAVARLIGSPPGYVGHEEGGQLTEALRRRPASVVLLDEIEKAHREVLLLLLQVLEDGRLTDGRGRTVDFSAAAIVMTSNLGSECYRRTRAPASSTVLASARGRLPAELWNRIDEVLCYAPLKEAELGDIVARLAGQSSLRLEGERGISFSIDAGVVEMVLKAEPDRSLGARPLRRAFERLVEGPIADAILAGRVSRGAHLQLRRGRRGDLVIA